MKVSDETDVISRKRPAHHPPVERFNQPVIVEVTVCAKDRRPCFARDEIHALCRDVWSKALMWRVGVYVIMPDHIHLFCAPGTVPVPSFKGWVEYWKSLISQRWPGGPRSVAAGEKKEDGTEPVPPGKLWQRDCWDTQMRSRQHYDEKASYVRMNPVRNGLVTDCTEWPYQGKIFDLRW